MSKKSGITRRTFIFGSAIGLAGIGFGRGQVRAQTKTPSPNGTVNIAGIGVGGKGWEDVNKAKREGNLVAICDADWGRAKQAMQSMDGVQKFKDFRVMFDTMGNDIDAVTVTTPDHNHAIIALTAMQLGKHVYCQKPLTYTISEARILTEAARKAGVVTQMGNQGHCYDGVRQLCEMVWNGDIGQVKEVHLWTDRPIWPQGIPAPTEAAEIPETLDWDVWQGPAPERAYSPKYLPFTWRGWKPYGCGALGDMACHIADPANWALKLTETGPSSVELVSIEGANADSFPIKSVIRYEFPARKGMDPVTVYWHDGGNLPPRPEGLAANEGLGDIKGGKNGSLFIGDKGLLTCGTYSDDPRLLPAAKMTDYKAPAATLPRIPDQNPYKNWVDSIKSGGKAESNFDYSGPFTEWVLLGNLALEFPDQKLEWDAKGMKVTNVPAANRFVSREARKGWELNV